MVSLGYMSPLRILGDVDVVSVENLKTLGAIQGPCISITMPTHRAGAETLQGSIRLRNLADDADSQLEVSGIGKRDAAPIVEPIFGLVSDADFWQHQADGLAVYSAPGFFRAFRVSTTLEEAATVSGAFRIRPLLPAVEGDGHFLLLALAENHVRLFETTRTSIGELDLGPIPASKAEALWYEDPERQLQYRQGGGESAIYHGHGLGDEVRKEELERFLRAVDRGLDERLDGTDRPLMLAAVASTAAMFRDVSDYPKIVEAVVEGSPERLRPDELHDRAWPLIEKILAERLTTVIDRFHDLTGSGRSATDVAELVVAAGQGRVDSLLIGEDAPEVWGDYDEANAKVEISSQRSPMDHDLIDLAASLTLRHGGGVHLVDRSIADDIVVAAVLRY